MSIELDKEENPSQEEFEAEVSQTEEKPPAEEEASDQASDAEEKPIISFGEQDEASEDTKGPAPAWVREMRKENRRLKKLLREREQAEAKAEKPKLPAKPRLEDFDYDADRFEAELEKWHDQKRAIQEAEAKERESVEQAQKAWEARVSKFTADLEALNVDDVDDAKEAVEATLSDVQQAIVVHVATDPARLVYALGKNPERLEELSKISDKALFAAAVARMEMKVTTSRRPAATPERTVKGATANVSSGTLDKLRAEAEKTGDYTKVLEYKRNQAAQKRA